MCIRDSGMGGHAAGERASAETVDFCVQFIKDAWPGDTGDILCEMAECVNRHVYELASSQAELTGMGTTLVAASICEDGIYCVNVGAVSYTNLPAAVRSSIGDCGSADRIEDVGREHLSRDGRYTKGGNMSDKGVLVVISGFSGAGKGTVVKRLVESGHFSLSISATTRAPRPCRLYTSRCV